MTENTYTIITEAMYVCNDCGAFADTPSQVVHHDTCEPGCSEFWAEYYGRAVEEESEA